MVMSSVNGRVQAVQQEYAVVVGAYDRRWCQYLQGTIAATMARVPLHAGQHVLDVGCGTGLLLRAMTDHESTIRVVGLDLSRAMLHRARSRLPVTVTLLQGDTTRLPFESATFDVVVSSSALHYAPHPDDALAEIARVLRPNGRLVLTIWCTDYWTTRLIDWLLRTVDPAHAQASGASHLRRLLLETGYSNIAIERYNIDWIWGLMTASATKPA